MFTLYECLAFYTPFKILPALLLWQQSLFYWIFSLFSTLSCLVITLSLSLYSLDSAFDAVTIKLNFLFTIEYTRWLFLNFKANCLKFLFLQSYCSFSLFILHIWDWVCVLMFLIFFLMLRAFRRPSCSIWNLKPTVCIRCWFYTKMSCLLFGLSD